MKKFGTTALAVLTALSLTCVVVGCGEKKKEPAKPNTPKEPAAPAGGDKPKPEGGH